MLKLSFTLPTKKCQNICVSGYTIYQHIFHILCKMTEETFGNVSINSEGSCKFLCLLKMNGMMVTPMNQLIIKAISSKFIILQMTGDKTIVIDKNDVVT